MTSHNFFIANFLAITDGMCVGWTSPMIPYFLSNETHIVMTRYQAEWMESALLLGATCGLPLTAFCVDRIGRKKSIIMACSVLIVTWTIIAVANHVGYIYAARFCQGIGLNMAFVAAPMYVGEISDKAIRGFLSSTIYVMSVLGVVVIYSIGPLLPFYIPSIIAVAILIIEILVFSFMPESPYFLVLRGFHEEAVISLRKFKNRYDVEKEINEIKISIEIDKKEKGRIQEIFSVKNYRKAILIMLFLNGGQLFCGFEVILMNLHDILTAAGSVYLTASNAGIIFASINLFASVVASAVVDRFGRKILLVISVILTVMCLFLMGLYFHLQFLGFDTVSYSWLPIVSVMTYAAVFKLGIGMVPIVITSEIFASKIKALGMTMADGVYVISSIVVLQIFFNLRDWFGIYVPFYAFSCCGLLTLIGVVFIVPETKGKSLEEIQEILRK